MCIRDSGISRNDSGDYEFLRRHTEFIAQREYAVSPNDAAADNRFSGVGAHPSLLTIQSVRMGPKFHDFPQLRLHVHLSNPPVESKTWTYHERVGSERPAERPGGVGQDWVPTELFAQETKVHRSLQGIEEPSLQRLSRSTNRRNPM